MYLNDDHSLYSSDMQARVFKVLSVAKRVQMLKLLKQRPCCVNALAKSLQITPAAISQHLRVLRDADMVIADKKGNFVHYRLNEKTMKKWAIIANDFFSISSD